MNRATILVVDDEAAARLFLKVVLMEEGHHVLEAASAGAAAAVLAREEIDLVFLDLRLPDQSGMSLLEGLAHAPAGRPRPDVVMMTGHGSIQAAVDAMKLGAVDFMEKPFEGPERVAMVVQRVLARRSLTRENARLRRELSGRFGELIGGAPSMRTLYELIERVADLPVNVLLTGESGTGKERVARTLHARSRQSGGPFIAVNCAAIPEGLLASTLFGHEKGAFTGADRARRGLFEEAAGGTLFLDEVGDMPPELQKGLLRVLQERRFTPVGGLAEKETSARIVAATHRDLPARVREGSFRQDLYYRLAVVELKVPPLRERAEDITLLARHFAERAAAQFGRELPTLEPALLIKLRGWAWPGNVRELENVVTRMVALAASPSLGPEVFVPEGGAQGGGLPDELDAEALSRLPLGEARSHFERVYLRLVLSRAAGNVRAAAEQAGIARQHFYRKMADYGLDG